MVSVLRPGADVRSPGPSPKSTASPPATACALADTSVAAGTVVVEYAALTGATAGAPDYRDQTPLVYYVPGEWKRRVIATENRA